MRLWHLPHITRRLRIILWVLLLGITLLLFPSFFFADLHYIWAPIESTQVLHNLPLFGALYYVWFGLLLFLLFSQDKRNEWENIALVCVFALVFSGKWILLTHGQSGATDVFQNAAPISYAVTDGVMPTKLSYLAYHEFPALAILGSSLALVTGLQTFTTITLFLVFQLLVFTVLSYILSRNYLQDGRLATIATLIVVSGSYSLAVFLVQYHARTTGILFLVTFLALVSNKDRVLSQRWQHALLFMILLSAMVTTHAITSVVFCLVLLGMYLVQRADKDKIVSFSLVKLALVAFLSYVVYVTPGTFQTLAGLILTTLGHITYGEMWSPLVSRSIAGNLGEAVPLWATIAKSFWVFVLIGLGGVFTLSNLVRIRSLQPTEKIITGGLIGIAVAGVLAGLVSRMEELVFRFLLYIPVLTALIVLLFLSKRKLVLVIFLALIFLLSFPTFLAHNSHVSTNALHPQEVSAAEFMRFSYQEEFPAVHINIYGPAANYAMIGGYLNNVHYTMFVAYPIPATTAGLWQAFEDFIAAFRNDRTPAPVIMLSSPRFATSFKSIGGIDPTTERRWYELRESLNQESKVYDNGFVQIYQAD